MKKLALLALASVMGLSMAAVANADPVEIELLFHKQESNAIDAMQGAIDSFNEQNPDIHVSMEQVPEAKTVLQTRATQNELPDIFGCTTDTLYETMFDEGMIMDLTGQDFLNNVQESSLELSEHDGKNWRLPYSLSAYGLYVRTDIFEEQGLELPTTWDELMDCCQKLQDAGISPFGLPDKTMVYQRMERMMSMLADNDDEFKQIAAGELAPEDSKVLSGYANASLQIADFTNPDSNGAEYEESYQMFLKGECAMTINGQWSLATLLGYDPDLKVAMIPLPNPLGEETKVIVSIDTGFAVSANTEHPDECLKFLDYLSQTDVAQAYTDLEGSPNVINGVSYNVKELEKINEAMTNGQIAVSLNAIWPAGMRKELGDVATNLILDRDLDTFYEDAADVISEYYNG